ncbi:MAG: hypothetical protein GXO78_06355 [Calditrichaeota bacterium]|nr:hypothetical protein [Calditrichota bacterium]
MRLHITIFFILGFLGLMTAQTYQKVSAAGATAVESQALQSLTALLLNSGRPIIAPIRTDSRQVIYFVQLNSYQIPMFLSMIQDHARMAQNYAISIEEYLQSFQKKRKTEEATSAESDSDRSSVEIIVPPPGSPTDSATIVIKLNGNKQKLSADSLRMIQRIQQIRSKLDSIAIKFLAQYADAGNRLPMDADLMLVFYLSGAESWFRQWGDSPLRVYRVKKRDVLQFRQGRISLASFSNRIQKETHSEIPLKVDVHVFTDILPTALRQVVPSQKIQFSQISPLYLKGNGMFFFFSMRWMTSTPSFFQTLSDADRDKRALQWLKNFIPGFIKVVQTYGTFLANLPEEDQLIFTFHSDMMSFNSDIEYFRIHIPVRALQQLRVGKISAAQFARQTHVYYALP